MTFDEAFAKLLGHEGGYVDNRNDSGGKTKYGISQRAYPLENIAGMTPERAKQIYHRDYWGPAGCDALPDGARLQVFDMAVNSGVKTAIRTVQKAIGEIPDGVFGPRTLMAIQSMPAARFIARFNGARLTYMTGLSDWQHFGRGWCNRIAANLMES